MNTMNQIEISYPDIDGIIYTHSNQPYEKIFKNIKFPIFKWKPVHLSTIDFFINIIDSDDSNEKIKIKLFNYDHNHQKIEFKKDHHYWVHKKDKEGNIIETDTVVECLYNIKEYKWEILKTRNDKTEFCNKYSKKWGNHISIATEIYEYVTMSNMKKDKLFYKKEKLENMTHFILD